MKTTANIGKQAFSDGSQGGGRNSLELQISHLERGIAEGKYILHASLRTSPLHDALFILRIHSFVQISS